MVGQRREGGQAVSFACARDPQLSTHPWDLEAQARHNGMLTVYGRQLGTLPWWKRASWSLTQPLRAPSNPC